MSIKVIPLNPYNISAYLNVKIAMFFQVRREGANQLIMFSGNLTTVQCSWSDIKYNQNLRL